MSIIQERIGVGPSIETVLDEVEPATLHLAVTPEDKIRSIGRKNGRKLGDALFQRLILIGGKRGLVKVRLRAIYDRVEKTNAIERYESAPRPDR